jgi:hypothetical protein
MEDLLIHCLTNIYSRCGGPYVRGLKSSSRIRTRREVDEDAFAFEAVRRMGSQRRAALTGAETGWHGLDGQLVLARTHHNSVSTSRHHSTDPYPLQIPLHPQKWPARGLGGLFR